MELVASLVLGLFGLLALWIMGRSRRVPGIAWLVVIAFVLLGLAGANLTMVGLAVLALAAWFLTKRAPNHKTGPRGPPRRFQRSRE